MGAGLGLILLLTVVVAYTAAYWNRVLPGVRIAGWEVGNMSGEEVATLIDRKTKEDKPEIEIVFDDQKRVVGWEELEAKVEVAETVNKVWLVGREGSWLERVGEAQRAFFEGIDLGLEIEIKEENLEAVIEEVEAMVNQEEVKPSLIKKEGELELEKGQLGRELQAEQLEKRVREVFGKWQKKSVEVPVVSKGEKLNEQKGEEALKEAEGLVGKRLVLRYEGNSWKLGEEDLLAWVKINEGGGFDRKAVAETVESLAEGINRKPQNATFKFEEGVVKEFRAAKDGWTVEEEKLIERIVDSWKKILEDEEVVIEVPLEKSKPEVTTAEVNDLGIEELIGKGDSTFYHSIANRIHNIGLAARRVSGTLVKPGEVFSLIETLGEVSSATGYRSAWVISNGRTELGDGGGVCQVSTTLFRAALNTGLPIMERHPHSYRVAYYEQDSPPGIDATVFAPRVDLKFKNNTPGHILIQAVVDESNRYLAFEIYGTDDGRRVTISEPRVWGQTPPPPPLYEDDPTLPEGQIRQIDWAAWGAKTSFDYKVSKNGEVLTEETFYSNYQPWQAVYLRGTKKD